MNRQSNATNAAVHRAAFGDYLRHLRPLSFPVIGFHMAAGFFVAHAGATSALTFEQWSVLPLAMTIWVIFLNGGTLAINSVYDRDEGDIGYLFNPPPAPRHLLGFSLALLCGGQALALLIGSRFGVVYAVCLILSLAYSVPPLRLKARSGWDLLINCAGYGALTFAAGWAATAAPFDARLAWAAAGYFLLYIAIYPLTQIYQLDEDRRRGDRTLAIALGKRWALRLSLAGACLGFAAFAMHLRADGLEWRGTGFLLAFAAWCAVLIPWIIRGERYDEKRGMYRALWAWALSDIAMAANALLK